MKRCPHCYAEFPDKYRFCQHDRTPLVEVEVSPISKSLQEAQETLKTQFDDLKPKLNKAAFELRQRYPKFWDWVRGHIVLLGSMVGALVILFILYQVFLKPKPDADGNKAALPFKECQNTYKARVDAAYQTFLSEFAGQKYPNRSDAESRVNALLSNDRETYKKCTETAEIKYKELTARYQNDSDDITQFSNAFTAAGGERKSLDEIEGSSSLSAALNEKLGTVRASYPDSQRIISDLLGKSMDGWNFAYTSEFKNVKVIAPKLDGDTLILRTHLNLEDYNTKEPHFAVLEITYRLNSNGEWDYEGFSELLYTKPGVDYFIGNEIFLVGKWRWEANYATYRPDGTWTGTWDSGSEASGNWRIVNDNLVLTRGGQTWTSTKIVRFTKTELIVGESSPLRAVRVE